MERKYTLDVHRDDDTDEYYIKFPDETMSELGWKEGDTIVWEDNRDGSFTLTKKEQEEEKEWVLVECVSMFRMRYMVEVPKGKDAWALDTVTLGEAKEFSQHHMDEIITSHRVVTEQEALSLCDEDNQYANGLPTDRKMEIFFTKFEDLKK